MMEAGHTFAAHSDGIGYTNGVELPADHSAILNGTLDRLSEVQHCLGSVS